MTALGTVPPGTRVKWRDGNDIEHTGIVREMVGGAIVTVIEEKHGHELVQALSIHTDVEIVE